MDISRALVEKKAAARMQYLFACFSNSFVYNDSWKKSFMKKWFKFIS